MEKFKISDGYRLDGSIRISGGRVMLKNTKSECRDVRHNYKLFDVVSRLSVFNHHHLPHND